ncbi:MAG: hypothetical protein PHC34_08920 [Candidatus Gastranaerophilales bacterium]|nr:hypothetical protein [Candidatus Gastranaerophilales bacterium]
MSTQINTITPTFPNNINPASGNIITSSPVNKMVSPGLLNPPTITPNPIAKILNQDILEKNRSKEPSSGIIEKYSGKILLPIAILAAAGYFLLGLKQKPITTLKELENYIAKQVQNDTNGFLSMIKIPPKTVDIKFHPEKYYAELEKQYNINLEELRKTKPFDLEEIKEIVEKAKDTVGKKNDVELTLHYITNLANRVVSDIEQVPFIRIHLNKLDEFTEELAKEEISNLRQVYTLRNEKKYLENPNFLKEIQRIELVFKNPFECKLPKEVKKNNGIIFEIVSPNLIDNKTIKTSFWSRLFNCFNGN